MKKYSIIIVLTISLFVICSCNKDTVTNSTSSDTLSFQFSNLNDSIITVNFIVSGSSTSQQRTYTINLNKNPLVERINITEISGGSLALNLYQDTVQRPSFIMNLVKDSTRLEAGPNNRLDIVPLNFKGRGSLSVRK